MIGLHYQKTILGANQMTYKSPGKNLIKITFKPIDDGKCIPGELKLVCVFAFGNMLASKQKSISERHLNKPCPA